MMLTKYIAHMVTLVPVLSLIGWFVFPIFDNKLFGVAVCALCLVLIMVIVDYLFIGAL
jgi:hypothetical protein